MNKMLKVFSTPMPYEQAHSQLTKSAGDFDSSDPLSASAGALIPAINKVFSQKAFVETQANAMIAGIEILLDRARTGRFADELPVGLPKNAFSGKDFEYEKKRWFYPSLPGQGFGQRRNPSVRVQAQKVT